MYLIRLLPSASSTRDRTPDCYNMVAESPTPVGAESDPKAVKKILVHGTTKYATVQSKSRFDEALTETFPYALLTSTLRRTPALIRYVSL